jgi:hypothetical protein
VASVVPQVSAEKSEEDTQPSTMTWNTLPYKWTCFHCADAFLFYAISDGLLIPEDIRLKENQLFARAVSAQALENKYGISGLIFLLPPSILYDSHQQRLNDALTSEDVKIKARAEWDKLRQQQYINLPPEIHGSAAPAKAGAAI